MSNTPGMGAGDAGTDNGADDAFDLNDVIGNAFDEASASGGEADAALASAEQTAAVQAAGDKPQTPPAETAPQQPNPSEWTANDDAALAALPPEAKALVDRRIASIEAGFKDKVTLADEVSAVVDPDFQRKLTESGMSIGQGVQYLANLERFASTQPAQYLAFVAGEVQKRGVDVAKALGFNQQAPQQGADQADPFADPRVAELQQQLGHLTTHIQTDSRQRALDNRQILGGAWVRFRDGRSGTTPAADTDEVLIDEKLLRSSILWRWRSDGGFDYAEDFRAVEERIARLANDYTKRQRGNSVAL